MGAAHGGLGGAAHGGLFVVGCPRGAGWYCSRDTFVASQRSIMGVFEVGRVGLGCHLLSALLSYVRYSHVCTPPPVCRLHPRLHLKVHPGILFKATCSSTGPRQILPLGSADLLAAADAGRLIPGTSIWRSGECQRLK